jgi:hypothetical protein
VVFSEPEDAEERSEGVGDVLIDVRLALCTVPSPNMVSYLFSRDSISNNKVWSKAWRLQRLPLSSFLPIAQVGALVV